MLGGVQKTRMAIVCCGGLAPGENDVVRALVLKVRRAGVEMQAAALPLPARF
jgi:6-phosphofructokinase